MKKDSKPTAELHIVCYPENQCKIELGGDHSDLSSALASLLKQGDDENPVCRILISAVGSIAMESIMENFDGSDDDKDNNKL
ncbi:MAG: hypothetical protein EBT26_02870 [Microbacteriaceae bacterium]|nr:hypothetical protein [Microbacteriaceae bacterium]